MAAPQQEVAPAQGAPGGAAGAQPGQAEDGGFFSSSMFRTFVQFAAMAVVMQTMTQRAPPRPPSAGDPAAGGPLAGHGPEGIPAGSLANEPYAQVGVRRGPLRNLYRATEECELYVHLGDRSQAPSMAAVLDKTAAAAEGFELLWQQKVWYAADAEQAGLNLTVGPFQPEVLNGSVSPHVHATLIRTPAFTTGQQVPTEEVLQHSLPLVAKLRELNADADADNLFSPTGSDRPPPKLKQEKKRPYFKTKLEVRPVFDQTVYPMETLQQGPFRRIRALPELGVYQPVLFLSDFWLLEKDYLPLNDTLLGRQLNLSLSYSVASVWAWSMQAQLSEQWQAQDGSDWSVTDPQRDSFMMKRLLIDTNPYFLAFSAAFISLHVVFQGLAFKNDVQFWRKNESMQGLSARSIVIRFVCTLVETLYLLDTQDVSRIIIFQILLDLGFAGWMLQKAVKVGFRPSFPFVTFAGQQGYDQSNTSQYDKEAMYYMGIIMTPFFLGYAVHSMLYGKHRGWYSYLVGTLAGGVYTFGFVMMTPQLYINYKLKSVEHLPWRALTYKAMNTFVDDIAAMLIDMPLMRRLSCFRDDVIFFIYLFQRWKYRVDKTRPSMWVQDETAEAVAAPAHAPDALDAPDAPDGGAAGSPEDAAAAAVGEVPAADPGAAKEPATSPSEPPVAVSDTDGATRVGSAEGDPAKDSAASPAASRRKGRAHEE